MATNQGSSNVHGSTLNYIIIMMMMISIIIVIYSIVDSHLVLVSAQVAVSTIRVNYSTTKTVLLESTETFQVGHHHPP